MSDVQHIAEIGFDLSPAYRQFEELEALFLQEATKLSDIAQKNIKVDFTTNLVGGVRQSYADMEREANATIKRVGMSWRNAKASLLDEYNTGARLTEYFKADGKKMAVQWTDEYQQHFESVAPELRKSLSSYITWTNDKTGIPFDSLSSELKGIFAELNNLDNPLKMLVSVNEKIVSYRELRDNRIQNGMADRFEEVAQAAEGSAAALAKITAQYEALGATDGIGRDGRYTLENLYSMADAVRQNAEYQAQVNIEQNRAGEVVGATLTYMDGLNNRYTEQYRLIQQVGEATGEAEVEFAKVRSTVVESEAATQRLTNQFVQLAAVMEEKGRRLAEFYQKSGDEQGLRSLAEIQAQVKALTESSFTYTRQQNTQLLGYSMQLERLNRLAKEEKSRASVLASQSAEQKKIFELCAQTADLQAKMRKGVFENTTLTAEGEALRQELETLYEIARVGKALTAQDKERLATLEKRVGVLQTEYAIGSSDAVSTFDDSADDGILARSGKWFGAYNIWHTAKRAATSGVTTMRDVETAMMEIARVLELTAAQSDSLRDKIFGLAQEFGREFDSAADIVLRFAQAGYDVQDSLTLARSALLAMNTAELDAENSTKALVGILKQWGYTAEQLMMVVDKLNYTADNASMTTQDLVDSLLRASSQARNAKFSFDETVGVVVALGEASGRTGREIGTAINSLISYTQKAGSLKAFEGLGVQVWANETRTELRSILDIWEDLALLVQQGGDSVLATLESQTDLTALYSEEVAAATDSLVEYNSMLEYQNQLNDKNLDDAERQTLYEQFGIYRRNYLIALLTNFSRVQEVVNGMHQAEGHSIQENSRYMDTLEAKYNQLITALKNLAVMLGEAGFMDLAKGLLESATAVAKLVQGVGNLVPVIITLTGVIGLLKQAKLQSVFDGAAVKVKTFIAALKALRADMITTGVSAKGLAGAFMGSFGLAGAVSLAVVAVGLLTSAVSAYNKKQRETREGLIAAASEAGNKANALNELADAYLRLNSIEERTNEQEAEFTGLQEQILAALGNRTTALAGLQYGTEEYTGALMEQLDAEHLLLQAETERGRKAAEQELSAAQGNYWGTQNAAGAVPLTRRRNLQGLDYADVVGDTVHEWARWMPEVQDADGMLEMYYKLIEAQMDLTSYANDNNDWGVFSSQIYKKLGEAIEEVAEEAEAYLDIMVRSEAYRANPKTFEDFEKLRDALHETAGATETQRQAVDKVLFDMYPRFASGAENVAGALEVQTDALVEWAETIDTSEEHIKGLVSALNTLENAMQTLAGGEGLTLDTALALIEAFPDLAGAVQWSGEAFYFSEGAMEAARQAQYLLRMETEMAAIATELSATLTDTQRVRLVELSEALRTATDATARQAAMTEYLDFVTRNTVGSTDALTASLARVQMLSHAAGAPVTARASGGGSGSSGRSQDLQRQQRETEKAYKAMQDAVKERYSTEIEALKALKQEQNRADARADYEKSRAELLAERAQMEQRTSREAVERIRAIDKELADLDEKEARRRRDNAIDDQIADLEARRDAEIAAIQEALDAAKESYQQQLDAIRSTGAASKARYEGELQNLAVVEAESARAAAEIEEEFYRLYQQVVDYSDQAALAQILNNEKVYMSIASIRAAMLGLGMGPISMQTYMNQTTGNSTRDAFAPPLPGLAGRMDEAAQQYRSSHTGSLVTEDGLVNLAAGEIVVREDISAGLLTMIEQNRQQVPGASGVGRSMVFNAPLQVVQRQEIADSADARRGASDVGALLLAQVRKLPM